MVGPGVGRRGDGCAPAVRRRVGRVRTEGILHRAARQRRGIHGHQRRLGPVVRVIIRGNGGGGGIRLADRHGHFLGRLRIGRGCRCRHDDIGFAVRRDLLDRQRAGGVVHGDVVPAAVLDGVADRAAACRGRGHAGADALVRVAVGGGHIVGGDGLHVLRRDGQRAVCIADAVVAARGCAGGNDVIDPGRGIVRGGCAAVLLIAQRRGGRQRVRAHKPRDGIVRVLDRRGEVGHRAAHIDALIDGLDGQRLCIDRNGIRRL